MPRGQAEISVARYVILMVGWKARDDIGSIRAALRSRPESETSVMGRLGLPKS